MHLKAFRIFALIIVCRKCISVHFLNWRKETNKWKNSTVCYRCSEMLRLCVLFFPCQLLRDKLCLGGLVLIKMFTGSLSFLRLLHELSFSSGLVMLTLIAKYLLTKTPTLCRKKNTFLNCWLKLSKLLLKHYRLLPLIAS